MFSRVVIAILAAAFFSAIIIFATTSILIDPYIDATDWGINLFNLYTNNQENNKIYIFGDSLSQCGIDPIYLEKYLQKNNKSFNIYHLFYPGDTPKARIVELSHIIESKPKIIIFCPQYRWFNTEYDAEIQDLSSPMEDRYTLVADKIALDPFIESLLDKKEISVFHRNPFDLFAYKRKFLSISLQTWLSKNPDEIMLYGLLPNRFWEFEAKKDSVRFKATLENNYSIARTITIPMAEISKKNNTQKKAFLHMVDTLKDNGIRVIIITMPYNPDYLKTFSNESINNYLRVINDTNCHHYNLASFCSNIEFRDYGHANFYGRQNITKELGKILLCDVKNILK